MPVRAVERWVAARKSRPRRARSRASERRARGLRRAALGALLLIAGLAHATQEDGTLRETLDGRANAPPLEAQSRKAAQNEPEEPLPRFTVGWYCPAPQANPLPDILGFGLGVALIWGMAARRKARGTQGA